MTTAPQLRTYQHDAVEAVFKEWEQHHSTMIVMATGLGKTVTFCEVIRRLHPARAIIIAHRTELIQQACAALERIGIRSEIEMAENKADASMFFGESTIVASVQSLISGRKDNKRMTKFRPQDFSLLVIDECFPAGTLVDGVPIEALEIGDHVNTFLPGGRIGFQRVTRKFTSIPKAMLRVRFSDGSSIACTPGHPFWSETRKAWVTALTLDSSDMVFRLITYEPPMQKLRNTNGTEKQIPQGSNPRREGSLLQSEMHEGVDEQKVRGGDGRNESETRLDKDERKKSNAVQGGSGESISDAQTDGAQTYRPGREWEGTDIPAADTWGSFRVDNRICDTNEGQEGEWVSDVLQSGPSQYESEGGNRNRRNIPQFFVPKSPRPKEGGFVERLRVDGVEVLEPTSDGTFGGVCPDGRVYNIEVEFAHHYFANGFLVHNCHHSVADSYKQVINHFRQNPALKIIGVSATPDRLDLKAMGQVYESCAYKYDIADAIEDGWLVPIEQQMIRIASLDYSHVRTTAGDLNGADLAKVMEDEKNLQGMVGASIEIIGTRKSIAFTSSVRHAEMCCDIFNRHRPGMADWICGTTSDDDRRRILKRFKSGEVQVLANVGIATEGFDVPDTEVIIMGRPTQSRALYTQCCGRGTRALPGVLDGLTSAYERREAIAESAKPVATVLDFVGNSGKHKLITTADILGGKYDEEVVKQATEEAQKSQKPAKMSELLKQIKARIERQKAEEAARKARLVAKVQYTKREISPFDAFDIKPRQDSKWDTGRPLSSNQRAVLQKMGVNPDELNYAAAKQLLIEHFKRREKGLCTLKQAQCLARAGINAKKVTFDEASRMIDQLKKNNFDPRTLVLV